MSRRLHEQASLTSIEPPPPPERGVYRTAVDATLDRALDREGDERLQALRIINSCHPESDRALCLFLEELSRNPLPSRRDEARTAVERWLAVRGLGDLRLLERIPRHLLELAQSGRGGHAPAAPTIGGDPALIDSYVDNDAIELLGDLRAVEQQPEPAEQARRLRQLTAKYPHDVDVCVYLGRAAAAGAQHDLAREAIDLALERMRRPCPPHRLEQLNEIAQYLQPLAVRTRAYEALLGVNREFGPTLRGRIIDLVEQGNFDAARVLLERGCGDPGFWDRLPEATRVAFARQPRLAAAQPDGPRFANGEYHINRLVHSSRRQRLYDAVAADGRPVTLRALIGPDPTLIHDVLLDLQTAPRPHPLVVAQRAIAEAADGSLFQVFDRLHGQTFGALHSHPTRDVDAMIDEVWFAAMAVAEVHRHGHVLAFNADDLIVLDANHEQRVAFLDRGFDLRRRAGKTPLLTDDPFPLEPGRRSEQRYRDLYALGALLYQGLTGRPPPSPYHERELRQLPEGDIGRKLRELLAELLDPQVVPQWGDAYRLADALDRLHVWQPRALHPGARLDSWTLIEILDEDGGQAEVWRASSPTHRHAAIKVLRETPQRSRAARLGISLEVEQMPNHEALPRIIDGGRLVAPSGALAYYAMELLEGMSLYRVLDHGPLDLKSAITLACQLVEPLLHVHRHGIVHGDVKPSNVYLERVRLEPQLRWDTLKLIDFGASQRTGLDRIGRMYRFIPEQGGAPELWEPAPLTPATDTYSFALLIYEMVTGKPPFDAIGDAEARHAHTNRPLPPHPLLDACPALAVLVQAMSAKLAGDRMALAEVRVELLRIAAALRLPFLQKTRGRVIDEPEVPLPPRRRLPLPPQPKPPVDEAPDPPIPPPLPPLVPSRAERLAPWVVAAASVALFIAALAYFLSTPGVAP